MHKGLIQIAQGNIAVDQSGVIGYFYEVTPVNSLFTNDSQVNTLVNLFVKKISKISMPGQIMILPQSIDTRQIIKNYNLVYRKYGKAIFKEMAQSAVNDVRKSLMQAIRYRYRILIVFTQDRPEFNKNMLRSISLISKIEIDKNTLDYASDMNSRIFAELSDGLEAVEVDSSEIERLMNYLAIPVEKDSETFYYTPQADHIEYSYHLKDDDPYDEREYKKVYARTIILSRLPIANKEEASLFNKAQLRNYPIDMIVKFEPMMRKQFVKRMQEKELKITESQEKHLKREGRRSKTIARELQLAQTVTQGEVADEKIKMKYQIMLRIRANTYELMLRRYKDLSAFFGADVEKDDNIQFSYDVGQQEVLADNLNPFAVTYQKHVNLTDVQFLAEYNWFGALNIGEKSKGIVFSYTRPGNLPVLVDPNAVIEGHTKSTAPITIICGESGSGKTQFANQLMVLMIVFFSIPTLCIDPKDDRGNMFKLFPKGSAQRVVLGSSEDQRGLFDPFRIYAQDESKAIEKAQAILLKMIRCINPGQRVNLANVRFAYENCVQDKKDKRIKNITLTEVTKRLIEFDKDWGENCLEQVNHSIGYLFFALHDQTKFAKFDLSYMFNLITFAQVKNLEKFDENNLDHQLFSMVVNQTETFIEQFRKLYPGQTKNLFMDELRIWNATSQGSSIVDNVVQMARSDLLNVILINTRYEVFKNVMDQVSQAYIGNLKEKTEIAAVIEHFDLTENSAVVDVLSDSTKQEGVVEDRKYRFLYIDYNNRKAVVRNEFLSQFKQAFNTHKKGDNLYEDDLLDSESIF